MSQASSVYSLGVAEFADGRRTILVRRDDRTVDLGDYIANSLQSVPEEVQDSLRAKSLDTLLAAGPEAWARAEKVALAALTDAATVKEPESFRLVRPFTVADYVDFYASREHAQNVGRIFRPTSPDLPAAWFALPIGYHGRSSSVVVSGTPVRRPAGLTRHGQNISFGPSLKLDLEAEVGFVVGTPSQLSEPVNIDDFESHVFGVCLVNDWSARDIQAFEYVPLGPFLGKSFATTISPWITPLSQLQGTRIEAQSAGDPNLDKYLRSSEPWGLDLELEVVINGEVVSRPPYSHMHWSPAQMLAHTTVNGAPLSTGDFFASGTVSGPDLTTVGSLLELTKDGTEPLSTKRGALGYLEDGDTVVVRGRAKFADGSTAELGSAEGTVYPTAHTH
ncbi:fumarylacetoacetate hydrolase family protein [Brevibacterium sp. BDJS002]|uniref:fumarylacetoacetate hydrolase family protein n=1 Tax=Brevibacterium sp. BDJS002 TaxID=3020906 RepID=UPI0023079A86|nr:fumarylacetoacetate hydrolase family protein [Brevibacterium sp. BDJS002]WCE41201.1 fumarylacetoacetate hydrolase family protein [Brevibacterium sp. BDJS002]